jgi:hypothetical protein
MRLQFLTNNSDLQRAALAFDRCFDLNNENDLVTVRTQ